jgi:uncharacterized protein YifE (UPF0438 family)
MSQQEAFAEAVLFFDGDDVAVELRYPEFEALLEQQSTLERFAASVVRGAYVVLGTGLAVRGLVCFLLRFDENGRADRNFTVPLRHLVRHAGPGPDIGCGAIRLASRAQCSVSWHAMNLWEPEGDGEQDSLRVIQRAAWRNRLGVRPLPADDAASQLLGDVEPRSEPPPDHAPKPAARAPRKNAKPQPMAPADDKIDRAFGEEGRISLTQLIEQHGAAIDALTRKHRQDIEQQQQTYLDQIRGCRDEIQRLKALLRHEQNRNRRLQQLLRGEVGP